MIWRRVSEHQIELFVFATGDITLRYPLALEVTPVDGSRYMVAARPSAAGRGKLISPEIQLLRDGKTEARFAPRLSTAVWDVRWFRWDRSLEWGDAQGWERVFSSAPAAQDRRRELSADFSFREPAPGIAPEYFAFEATTAIEVPAGRYVIAALPDDGLQVWVDGREVISAWRATPGHQRAVVELSRGRHNFRVRFAQSWGHSYLRFAIRGQDEASGRDGALEDLAQRKSR